MVKAMQKHVHIIYEDGRKCCNRKTKPKPDILGDLEIPVRTYGHPNKILSVCVRCTASAWDSAIVALVGCGGRKAVLKHAFSGPQEGLSSVSLHFLPHSQILQFITQPKLKTSLCVCYAGSESEPKKKK